MSFYSRGKLLLSGEYLVLKGATALAVPLLKGQGLEVVKSGEKKSFSWISKEFGKTWFSARFELPFFDVVESSDDEIANNLQRLIKSILLMKPEFEKELVGAEATSHLEFNREWGFGSSSTLISNLAFWSGIDPFDLNAKTSQGSGYDVVVAREDGPVYFSRDDQSYKLEEVNLNTSLIQNIHFVYLGNKEGTAQNVARFLGTKKPKRQDIRLISDLSYHLGNARNLEDFEYYMKEHEQILASILKEPMLKDGLLKDFPGEAKSLGAWGGDFAMITWNDSNEALRTYLKKKNFNTCYSFNELVKTR